jgi:hypothetical protein
MPEEVQVRHESGEMKYFFHIKDALAYAKDKDDVWKISFPFNGERVRLVRNHYFDDMSEEHWVWIYEDIFGNRT